MVNFRFHLISLTAVFLALGIGIAVGATVVDRATVDALQDQLDRVERGVDVTSAENARLSAELGRWDSFAEQSRDLAVAGRLADVPVLLVGMAGIDRGPVGELQQAFAASGAVVEGTVWLTSKLRLDRPEDVLQLGTILGSDVRIPEVLRGSALAALATELAGEVPSTLLVALRDAAFVEFEEPAGDPSGPAAVPRPGSRFVVVSDAGAEVPNDQLAVPFTELLARRAGARVLAAEAGTAGQPGRPGVRAAFVGPLREGGASTLVSTVDNLEDHRGRFSVVYALRDLSDGKIGHFGVGPRATRLVPETAA
jgi:hypothetical protein